MSNFERLPSEVYAPRKDLVYVDYNGTQDIFTKLAFKGHLLLEGPKGIGKSLSVAKFAADIKSPIVSFSCSEDVRRSHLIGQFTMRGDETPFILGPLPTAFEVANEVGMCILVLEEVNALTPQAQKVLNSVLDFRRSIEAPEAKTIFRLKPEAKLWVVGTMNDSTYAGVYALNEDLKSRFRIMPLGYPTAHHEKQLIEAISGDSVKALSTAMLKQIFSLVHETRQGNLEYALSPRDLVQIIEDIGTVGLEKALFLSSGKFEGENRKTFNQRVKSIFDIKLGA